MAKDKRARHDNRMTAFALANLIAAIADAMEDAHVPRVTIHRFLNRLDDLNTLQMWGEPLEFLEEIIEIVRRAIPGND